MQYQTLPTRSPFPRQAFPSPPQSEPLVQPHRLRVALNFRDMCKLSTSGLHLKPHQAILPDSTPTFYTPPIHISQNDKSTANPLHRPARRLGTSSFPTSAPHLYSVQYEMDRQKLTVDGVIQLYMVTFLGLLPLPDLIQSEIIPVVRYMTSSPSPRISTCLQATFLHATFPPRSNPD